MTSRRTEGASSYIQDKQLRGIDFETVLEKRRLDQAMNAKEFAVCAGVSYSTAREWFHLPNFPVIRGVVFWQDFVSWRSEQKEHKDAFNQNRERMTIAASSRLPTRAMQILSQAE